MRVVTATNKGKMLTMAEQIAKIGESSYAVDSIPPAYPMERERLVVIVASLTTNMPSSFSIFCKDMSKDRTANVALVVDGTEEKSKEAVAIVRDAVSSAGARFCEDILYVHGGLPFKFLKKTTPAEDEIVKSWTEKVLSSLS